MTITYKKIIIVCTICASILLVFALTHSSTRRLFNSESENALADYMEVNGSIKGLKFILQWTPADRDPFIYMGVGRRGFINRKCAYTNCFVTSQRDLLSLTEYDVIAFDGPALMSMPMLNKDFPSERSPRQKYVFASMESSSNYPVCSNRLDGFFNWTWTYRLDSNTMWGYMLIKDSRNAVIGPSKLMHWMHSRDMESVSQDFKEKLRSKTKAVAWFVSNCNDQAGRFKFAKRLEKELKKFELDLDVFGRCGTMKCSFDQREKCDKMIANTYYFYLAFENSFSEDYVTEKLLRALKNDAVPIVFGGANYTRFMPDGIYLDARTLGPEQLAQRMFELIQHPDQYAEMFKWRNHYSYHSREESPEHNDYCEFCAMINDEERMAAQTTIQRFREWWDPPNNMC